ncbi:MAG: amidohydrolase family protein [Candidatus Lokiarchaeota archaeon]|nr:amidohydrolase family protein [Candidatus Lokiarchaeota archaeon]
MGRQIWCLDHVFPIRVQIMEIEADLVVFNGNIITMDPELPNASCFATKSWKFFAVGEEEHIQDLIMTAKRVIDLGGKTVLPGFIDAHTHITSAGIREDHIHLHAMKSIDEIKKTISEALHKYKKESWILGHGWDESKWPEKRYITMTDLDEVSTEHAILLDRIDGHLTSVNSMAFKKLKLDEKHEGIIRDKKGNPTGILKDIEGLHNEISISEEEIQKGILSAGRIATRHGITTVVDNAVSGMLRHLRTAEFENDLHARFVVNPPDKMMTPMIKLGITSCWGSPMLKIGGVKIFVDGSIGARTAYVSEPYNDDPENRGILVYDKKKLKRIVRNAISNDIQTVIHAIGDEAIEMVITVFEEIKDKEAIRRQRHRIEHAEMISEYQIRRAVSQGLILSMQPNFVGEWQQKDGMYVDRLGEERTRGMNMFRVALDNGARVCFGSDGMPYGPLYGIWSAVTHHNDRVRLELEEAIRCYTMEGAYSVFMEHTIGSIKVGKRADFVVLSDNIAKIPKEQIKDITIESTFVGGIEEFSAHRQ